MASDQKEQGGFKTLWMVLVLFAAMGAWMFISTGQLLTTLVEERSFVAQLSGRQAEQWIFSKMIDSSSHQLGDVAKAVHIEGARQDVPAVFREWILDRILVTWLWGTLILYRLNVLLLFWLILMPFTIAVAADGFYTRLIRTFRFSSQSPIRHRVGVTLSMISIFSALIWLILPVPMPTMIAPLVIIAVGWATWMWESNLQKRI